MKFGAGSENQAVLRFVQCIDTIAGAEAGGFQEVAAIKPRGGGWRGVAGDGLIGAPTRRRDTRA